MEAEAGEVERVGTAVPTRSTMPMISWPTTQG
jgi:hypothetical protein